MELPLLASLTIVSLALGCAPLAKMDGWNPFSRDSFQLPDRTLAAIPISPGARVADLGAGDGYFTWKLAERVGPSGHVFAVEVDDAKVRRLERGRSERALANVEVVRGGYEDPGLPDGRVDVVLLSSVYHHIDDRVAYMARLRSDLAPGARVAIVEPRASWESWLLLLPPGHGVASGTIEAEMRAAGYRPIDRFEFLPAHSFAVFAASDGTTPAP
jgi:SAM-dependent methyltransferase